jgi:drug/metabolite transporter (DMT)-like permease
MGYLKIISAILIWSSLGVFVRKSGMPNTAIVFYQALIAGTFQLLVLSVTGGLRSHGAVKNSKRGSFLIALLSLCLLANMLLFYFAFTHTTIAKALLTHYTAPVFVALLAPLFLREKILRRTWVMIVISSVGLWFILREAAPDGAIFSRASELRGITAGVLSGLAYAGIILILRGIALEFSSLFVVFIQNGIISLALLPFVLTAPLTAGSLPYLLIMGILHSTIAPLLYFQGFKSVQAGDAAVLGYLEAVGAIILAQMVLHEVPGINTVIGGALIVCSGIIIVRKGIT